MSLDHLGEDTTDPEHRGRGGQGVPVRARPARRRGADAGRPRSAVKLSAVGQALPGDGERIALEHAPTGLRGRRSGPAPRSRSTWRTTPRPTRRCGILAELRKDFPDTGAVLQSYLRRTEADCRDLATAGLAGSGCARAPTRSRPASRSRTGAEVDKSYVRCLTILMAGARLPDGRHPRPAADRDRPGPGGGQRPRDRTRTSSRCCTASGRTSSSGWPSSGTRCGSTCRTARTGTATSCAGWPSDRPTWRSSCARWRPRS